MIFYAGCPIVWKSKLQTEFALSTTESEIISLSTALKVVIPLMEIAQEMQGKGYDILSTQTVVQCRAFQDNSGALELASTPKYRPRTRYLSVKLFHFRHFAKQKRITLSKCDTHEQTADVFTKSLDVETFTLHRTSICGECEIYVNKRECWNPVPPPLQRFAGLQNMILANRPVPAEGVLHPFRVPSYDVPLHFTFHAGPKRAEKAKGPKQPHRYYFFWPDGLRRPLYGE